MDLVPRGPMSAQRELRAGPRIHSLGPERRKRSPSAACRSGGPRSSLEPVWWSRFVPIRPEAQPMRQAQQAAKPSRSVP